MVYFEKSKFLLGSEKTLMWNFVVGLAPTQKQHDFIWVVVDSLINSIHFIPFKFTYSAENYERIFIDEIVCWQGIPLSITSDRGAQFISRF